MSTGARAGLRTAAAVGGIGDIGDGAVVNEEQPLLLLRVESLKGLESMLERDRGRHPPPHAAVAAPSSFAGVYELACGDSATTGQEHRAVNGLPVWVQRSASKQKCIHVLYSDTKGRWAITQSERLGLNRNFVCTPPHRGGKKAPHSLPWGTTVAGSWAKRSPPVTVTSISQTIPTSSRVLGHRLARVTGDEESENTSRARRGPSLDRPAKAPSSFSSLRTSEESFPTTQLAGSIFPAPNSAASVFQLISGNEIGDNKYISSNSSQHTHRSDDVSVPAVRRLRSFASPSYHSPPAAELT